MDSSNRQPEMARHLLLGWRWFDDQLRERLAEHGFGEITTAQSMIFPFLDEGGTRPSALGERLGMTRQAVHQLLAGLRDYGLVELVPDPTSGRSKLARLTERGRQSVAAAQESLVALETELADRLGHDNAETLHALLAQAFGPDQPDRRQ